MRIVLIILGVLLLSAAGGFAALTRTVTLSEADLPEHDPDPERGEWVFHAAGCNSCHAAPEAEGEAKLRLGGGLPLKTPFGTFYAPNISPHADGIGGWSDLDFVNALLRGVSPEGEHYYPAFPYLSYQKMRIADALDLKAYMDTLPPVAGNAPEHDLPLLFHMRQGVGLWKRVYMDYETFEPDPTEGALMRRGAYLVQALGHCGECHTPRDPFGGPQLERAFAGGPAPEGDGRIPNITPHEDGIADWSIDDIKAALRTGLLPDFDTFGGAMVHVQENMAKLSEEDREAIALYLKSLPPKPDQPNAPEA